VLRSVIGLALCVLAADTAAAQPFGRNKVHYEDLAFRVLVTPHFDIYYYPAEHEATLHAARMAERWYDRLSATLHHQFTERQPIVFYASHAQFAQTNVLPGFIPDSVGGVTEHERGRVVLPFAAGLGDTDHVLGHELVHAFQRDILRSTGRSMSLLPLWFLEGMAEYLSIGRLDANTAMWLRDAVREPLPSIDRLDDGRWFPYRYGQALWAYLVGRFGEEVVDTSLSARGNAVARIVSATGLDAAALSRGWHEWIHALAGDGYDDDASRPRPFPSSQDRVILEVLEPPKHDHSVALEPGVREESRRCAVAQPDTDADLRRMPSAPQHGIRRERIAQAGRTPRPAARHRHDGLCNLPGGVISVGAGARRL
jgi:hypothetical protein